MQKDQLGQSELRDIVGRYGQVAVQSDVLDDLFDRLVFPQELVSRLDPDPRDRIEVITACEDLSSGSEPESNQPDPKVGEIYQPTHGHPPKLGFSPSDKTKLAARRKIIPYDVYTLAIPVELVNDLSHGHISDLARLPSVFRHEDCGSRFDTQRRVDLNLP